MADQQVTIIEVAADTVRAIQGVESGDTLELHNERVIAIADTSAEPIAAIEELLAGGNGSGPLFVQVGVHHFFFRLLRLPFKDKKQLQALIPLELQDQVSFDLNDYYYTPLFNGFDGQETEILIILVKKQLVDALHLVAQQYHFAIELLTVAGLPQLWALVENGSPATASTVQAGVSIGAEYAGIFIIEQAKLRFARAARFDRQSPVESLGTIIKTTMQHPRCKKVVKPHGGCILLAGSAAIRKQWQQILDRAGAVGPSGVEPSSRLDEHHREVLKAEPFSSLRNPAARTADGCFGVNFARKTSAKRGNRLRVSEPLLTYSKIAAAALLGLLVILAGLDYLQLNRLLQASEKRLAVLYDRLNLPVENDFQESMNLLNREVEKLRVIEAAARGNEAGSKAVDMLHEISQRLPADLSVTMVRLRYDRKTMQLSGVTDSFASVDRILMQLKRAVYFRSVTISSANADDLTGAIRFELQLEI